MNKKKNLDLSVVVPVYNEAENIMALYEEIKGSCQKLHRSYEIIIIDDGSQDNSFSILKNIQGRDPMVRIIRLRKNFGQTPAMSAGFHHARGDIIITLDGDLQNDPGDFNLLIKKLEEGYDIVSGWRKKRKDKFITRRIPSAIANWLISSITHVRLHDYGCTLKAFRREVIKNIQLYGELHRFIPAIASDMGVSIAEVEVNHRPRIKGKSKYNIWRFPKVILDLMTVKFLLTYSTRPLQIFGIFGFISGIIGLGLGIFVSYERLILLKGSANRPLLWLAILLIVVAIQFVSLGLLAEIMVRAYHESSNKRIYHVREIIESDPDPDEK